MRIIEGSIRYPVTTVVGVLLLFGGLALVRIPVQLTPDVEEPQISVNTSWPGASPQEVEREIVDEQEEQLKSLEGLNKMESSSSDSLGTVILTFAVGTNVDTALLRVANRLPSGLPRRGRLGRTVTLRKADSSVTARTLLTLSSSRNWSSMRVSDSRSARAGSITTTSRRG